MAISHPVTAFFFDADITPTVGGRYDTLPKTALFRRILELDLTDTEFFALRSGDLLLHNLAYRTEAVDIIASNGCVDRVSTRLTADRDLYALVLWDFVDSFSYAWTSIDLVDQTEATMLFGRCNIFTLVTVGLTHNLVLECDAVFENEPGYIGAAELDLGNPLHLRAMDLPHTLTYRGRRLAILGDVYDVDSLMETTWSQGEWPYELAFRSVEAADRWATDSEWMGPPVETVAVSLRGALSARRLNARAQASHFEKVAGDLTHHRRPIKNEAPTSVSIGMAVRDPVVDPRKLVDYALTKDPSRRGGYSKAQVFRKALGIEAEDWRFLAAQLILGLANAAPLSVRSTPFGVKYEAVIPVCGRNGEFAPVLSAWIIEGDQPPRLTSVRVANRGTALPAGAIPDVPVLPIGEERDWRKLYDLSQGVADEAAANAVPTPMFLVGYRPIEDGMCGTASITIPDGRRSFPRWLVRNSYAYRSHVAGVVVFAAVGSSQSLDKATAWAQAFATVLRLNGVECEVKMHVD